MQRTNYTKDIATIMPRIINSINLKNHVVSQKTKI
jgi:hypothetical protein